MLTREDVKIVQRIAGDAAAKVAAKGNPENVRDFRRDFFIYESSADALAAGGNANDIINIEADSNFLLQKLAYYATIADAAFTDSTRPVPNVTVQLVDSGSGRQLMQNPVPIPSFFGTGELPFILPNPRLFLANSTLQIAYANFDAAAAYNIRLAFIGYKVYETV